MFSHLRIDLLRILLVVALVLILALQILFLPWLSGEMAADLPAEAYMRWPILGLAIAGLVCVEVGIVCTLRLLGITRRGDLFTPQSLRWVFGLMIAFLAGAAVCVATLVYQSFTVSGPPAWALTLLAGVGGGIGMALLTAVLRSRLVEAIALRQEMARVI